MSTLYTEIATLSKEVNLQERLYELKRIICLSNRDFFQILKSQSTPERRLFSILLRWCQMTDPERARAELANALERMDLYALAERFLRSYVEDCAIEDDDVFMDCI